VKPQHAIALFLFFITACSASKTDTDLPSGDTQEPTNCEAPAPTTDDSTWQVLDFCRAEGELLSVSGTGPENVWVVGAQGQALHYDGCQWKEVDTGTTQTLWWTFGFEEGPQYFVGANGTILKHTTETGFEAMESGVQFTLYGIWGTSPEDLWTIGFDVDQKVPGAILHYDGSTWTPVSGLPESVSDSTNYFKVWGSGPNDVWVVGRNDLILHWDGAEWSDRASGLSTDWVTITGTSAEDVIIVGGKSGGAIVQWSGDSWTPVAPELIQLLQGVCLQPDGSGLATGISATFLRRTAEGAWSEDWDAPFDLFSPFEPPVAGCQQPTPDYHACFADGSGGFYAVGGNFFGGLTEGAVVYFGPRKHSALP
jgi:hypothetical protein